MQGWWHHIHSQSHMQRLGWSVWRGETTKNAYKHGLRHLFIEVRAPIKDTSKPNTQILREKNQQIKVKLEVTGVYSRVSNNSTENKSTNMQISISVNLYSVFNKSTEFENHKSVLFLVFNKSTDMRYYLLHTGTGHLNSNYSYCPSLM